MRTHVLRLLTALAVVATGVLAAPPAQAAAWPLVSSGDAGPNVFTVQHLLTARGHAVTADGDFGAGTVTKVKAFQTANRLGADGAVGAATWAKLVVTVRQGDTGDAVSALQHQLNKYGYAVPVIGTFGPATNAAVRDFQSANGLTVDGIVGPASWQQLAGGAGDPVEIATRIRDDAGITLMTTHVSGTPHRPSSARGNIELTADGLAAVTSPWSDVGERDVDLDTRMLIGALNLRTFYNFTYRVTEFAGGDHSANSRHYAGLALDVDQINGAAVSASNPHFRAFMAGCRAFGATEVLGPGDANHNGHVHCAWPRS